jgi:glucose-6-phosphate 1-dehydrogenase
MALVLVGATGDLGRRKLIPALASLQEKGVTLPQMILVGRRSLTQDEIIHTLCSQVPGDQCPRFVGQVRYVQGDSADPVTVQTLYGMVQDPEVLTWYCALTPMAVQGMIDTLCALPEDARSRTRLVLEKPFGTDAYDAERRMQQLRAAFSDDQLYLIDHYIAKETIENFITLRTANRLLSRAWTTEDIADITVRFSETEQVGHRLELYRSIGIVRDVVQNHLLLIAAATCADLVPGQSVSTQRSMIAEFLRSIAPADPAESSIWSDPSLPEVVATGVKTTLHSNHPRWSSVPIFIEAMKHAEESDVSVTVMFRGDVTACEYLRFTLQPKERFTISVLTRGPEGLTEAAFSHDFPPMHYADAYECLLADILSWDRMFAMPYEVIAEGWRIVGPLLSMPIAQK